ncbi:DUF1697 domain-containing protein [Anatilimnocola floriformis]|uniref:DUF1697 domain-containing protein n=1 Tax=Anatilimnocola floriformis TaxID=2948575 RepID=UPI0020C1FFB6|nr:DUF1697 domain-containing protein [Anatilimnocola floriformis]
MPTYIALLRAVNVGGTGKLPMTELVAMCEELGFENVRTYIASGNVVFRSKLSAAKVKKSLEQALEEYAGKPVGVHIRTPAEMAAVAADNPFPSAAKNHTVAIFLDTPTKPAMLENIAGQDQEEVALGKKEIYVSYGPTMGQSKLKIPAAKTGTARNMNTVAKLAAMAAE